MLLPGKARFAGGHVPPLSPSRRESRGLYHVGRFATPDALLDHCDAQLLLELTSAETNDLAGYLRSLRVRALRRFRRQRLSHNTKRQRGERPGAHGLTRLDL